MGGCIIAQKSLTYAMKSEDLLRNSGIRCKVLRISPEKTKAGCGFGIELDCNQMAAAKRLLRSAGIPIGELQP